MKFADGMTFGEHLAALRRIAEATQAEIANRLGVTPQAVSGWERDEAEPELSKVVPLADALGVSVERLLRPNEERPDAALREENALLRKTLINIDAILTPALTKVLK